MPFNDPASALRDIQEAIARIEEFTSGVDSETFRQDLKTIAAVERKLQVISEAAIRLGEEAERICPGPPWLRHQYDRIDLDTVWLTVSGDLPPLKLAVARAINRLSNAPID